MKYILIFIQPIEDFGADNLLPGTMFEVNRFDSIEDAVKATKNYPHHVAKNTIIIPYYDITD